MIAVPFGVSTVRSAAARCSHRRKSSIRFTRRTLEVCDAAFQEAALGAVGSQLERTLERRTRFARSARGGGAARRGSSGSTGSRRAVACRRFGGRRSGPSPPRPRRRGSARRPVTPSRARARHRAPRSRSSRSARRRGATRSRPAGRTGRGRAARARGASDSRPAAIFAASYSERSWSASSTSSPSAKRADAARVVEQHQREERVRLGLVRHQLGECRAEPDRVGGEVAAAGVALVEDEVDDGEHRREPLGQQVRRRYAKRDAGRFDLVLRADESLRHRRLRHEERAGDLVGRAGRRGCAASARPARRARARGGST